MGKARSNRFGSSLTAMGFGGLLFFTVFWCSITGVFVGLVAVTAYRVADANLRFLPTEGTVTASRVETSQDSDGDTVRTPVVEYSYTVAGRPYQSKRYTCMVGNFSSGSRGYAEAVVTKHPAGARITVYYDPQHPEAAVVDRSLPDMLLFLTLFLQPFVLVGLGMMIATGLAARGLWRQRAFRRGGTRRPPWPIPTWGVLRQEARGLFVLRGGGRVQAAAAAFAAGYGATCFFSIFVVAFGFLLLLGGKQGVAVPVVAAFALALAVGAFAAHRAWSQGEPRVTFTFHQPRSRITLVGGEYRTPVDLQLHEVTGLRLHQEWRTQQTSDGPTRERVFLPKLIAADGRELALTEMADREDAEHPLAEFAALLGKPLLPAAEPVDTETNPPPQPPKSIGELLSRLRGRKKQ